MKCDELKDRWFWAYPTESVDCDGITGSAHEVYGKSEVDTAIDELKTEHHRERHEYIEMVALLRRENAELKAKLENVQASAYADSVDAGMRERRLRRLLWHAIALFCARSCEYFNGIMSHCLMGQDDLYRRCEEKKNKYLNAMYKCRAKADEYK